MKRLSLPPLAAALLALGLAASAGLRAQPLAAQAGAGGLPEPAAVEAALLASPLLAAAREELKAEAAGARQLQLGPHEWTLGVSAARRRLDPAAGARSSDLELSLERSLRLPGKQAAAERLGQARIEAARAAWARDWHAQAGSLLDALARWHREGLQARRLARQTALAAEEARAVTRRQQLGDASALEALQAEAALAQWQAQHRAAEGRAAAAELLLQQHFPGLPLPAPELPAPPAAATERAGEARHAGLEALAREREAASAALAAETLERRPDPTLGVQLGRASLDGERRIGLSLSLPFGGAARDAGLQAGQARLAAQDARLAQARRELAAQQAARLREAQAQHAAWQAAQAAAQRLEQLGRSLERSHALGEASLAELLQARRLAHEQGLAAELAALDAWLLHWQIALDSGRLWPAPAPR